MIAYKEVKSILNKHKQRDNWFLDDYSANPYEGGDFNCTYSSVHYPSWEYQVQLKKRADLLCEKHNLKNKIR